MCAISCVLRARSRAPNLLEPLVEHPYQGFVFVLRNGVRDATGSAPATVARRGRAADVELVERCAGHSRLDRERKKKKKWTKKKDPGLRVLHAVCGRANLNGATGRATRQT